MVCRVELPKCLKLRVSMAPNSFDAAQPGLGIIGLKRLKSVLRTRVSKGRLSVLLDMLGENDAFQMPFSPILGFVQMVN